MFKWNLSNYSLEDRFFIRLLYLAILVGVISLIENNIIGLPFYVNYKWMVIIVLCSIAVNSVLQHKNIVLWKNTIFFIIIFFILPYGWMIYGAYNELTMVYASLICISICFLLEKKQRIFFLIGEFLVICILLIFNDQLPLMFRNTNNSFYALDMSIQIPLTFGAMTYICINYANAWRNEHQMLEKLSKEDSLTGVYNRRFIFKYLNQLKDQKKNVQIAMIDIDNLKTINDDLGHIIGDKVICQVCQDIQCIFKEYGMIGRYGGDEFLVIIEGLGKEDCLMKLEELRKLLKNSSCYENYPITISCGLVTFKSDHDIDESLSHVDNLLYKIKNTGKDGIACEAS